MGGDRIRGASQDLERPPGGILMDRCAERIPRGQRFDAGIAASPVPIVVIDGGTTVRIWNPAAERLFGCSKEKVADGSIPIVPFEKRDELRTGRTRGIRAIVVTREDAGERHRVQAAAQKMLQTLATSWDGIPVVVSELDSRQLLQTLTDACTLIAGAQFGAASFNFADDESGSYLLYACSGASRPALRRLAILRRTTASTPMVAGEGMYRLGWASIPPQGAALEYLPIGGYLAVPMIGRSGDVSGGLFLGHPEADVFTTESNRVVRTLAARAAVAIDRVRLYEAERRARNATDAANRAKDEFLAVLGHEWRNRLSTERNDVATARLDPARHTSHHHGRPRQ